MNLKCQICQTKDSTIRITRITEGKLAEFHVCASCADAVSPFHAQLGKKKKAETLSVENLLKDLLESQGGMVVRSGDEELLPPTCHGCGLDYQRYKQTYMLGCPDCYDAFGDLLEQDIVRIHGSKMHVERQPGSGGGALAEVSSPAEVGLPVRLAQLQSELARCIDDEDYGGAAKLRDEIRRLTAAIEEARE